MAIPTQDPWNSSHLEHPRESCETAKAGQRRKCHIIELAERSSVYEAGQRGKCNRIELSECPGLAGCHVYRLGEMDEPPSRSIHAHMLTQSREHGTR